MSTPPTTPYDLVIHAGRVVCPAMGLDGPGAVAVRGDRIAAVLDAAASAALPPESARQSLSFADSILLPGLVDMHAHPAQDSKYGIDPDIHFLPYGSTTILSQGDAGAHNWARYKQETVAGSRTRIRMALNLSATGESNEEGCFANLADADVNACAATVRQDPELIWGIALNVGPTNCRDNDPREIMARGLAAAERTGKPLLIGQRRHDDWSLDEQFDLLRPGDVVTYCFHARGGNPVADGRVRDSVWAARKRGIIFDLGHGFDSFSFDVATTAIGDGFLPDTISSDVYVRHVGVSPRHHAAGQWPSSAAGMQEANLAPVTSRPRRGSSVWRTRSLRSRSAPAPTWPCSLDAEPQTTADAAGQRTHWRRLDGAHRRGGNIVGNT